MTLVNKFLEDFLPYDRNYTINTSRRDDKPHSADYFYIKVLEKREDGSERECGYIRDTSTPDDIKLIGGTFNNNAKEFKDKDEAKDFIEKAEPLPHGKRFVVYRPTIFPRSWY